VKLFNCLPGAGVGALVGAAVVGAKIASVLKSKDE
jgi:hypothetical protein